MTDHPAVTIALPLHNGATYMRRAIDSVLGQSFTDLELIISDNASSDRSSAIAREYAARDARVRYVRHEQLLDISANFLHALGLARGEFFAWIAHDDYYDDEQHLARLVDALRAGASLAFPNVNVVHYDENAQVVSVTRDHFGAFRGTLRHLDWVRLAVKYPSQQFYGLYRIETVRRHIHLWEECSDLRCFGEGRFVQKVLCEERCAFVDDAALNVGMHSSNASRSVEPRRLVRDYARYSAGLLSDYFRSASLTATEKLAVFARIARLHLPYAARLAGSVVKSSLR